MKKIINKPILIARIIISNLMAVGFIAIVMVQYFHPTITPQQGVFQVQSLLSDNEDYCKQCSEICLSAPLGESTQ